MLMISTVVQCTGVKLLMIIMYSCAMLWNYIAYDKHSCSMHSNQNSYLKHSCAMHWNLICL